MAGSTSSYSMAATIGWSRPAVCADASSASASPLRDAHTTGSSTAATRRAPLDPCRLNTHRLHRAVFFLPPRYIWPTPALLTCCCRASLLAGPSRSTWRAAA
eukprot:6855620-Prymnesium_polylepis.1